MKDNSNISAKHTPVNRKFRIDNQPGACHSVILDDSPTPKGRRAKLIDQIALVDMSLPDSEAILNMFAAAPETLRQRDALLEACRNLMAVIDGACLSLTVIEAANAAIADCEATKD